MAFEGDDYLNQIAFSNSNSILTVEPGTLTKGSKKSGALRFAILVLFTVKTKIIAFLYFTTPLSGNKAYAFPDQNFRIPTGISHNNATQKTYIHLWI